jgi:hypothetical protein
MDILRAFLSNPWLTGVALVLLLWVVGVVTYSILRGREVTLWKLTIGRTPTVEDAKKSSTPASGGDFQGMYCDSADSEFTIEFLHLGNEIYKVDNPNEHWDGVGFFKGGRHYFGVYRYKDNALPKERRGEWGLHRGEVRPTDGALQMQTLGVGETEWSPGFVWCRRFSRKG